MEQSVSRRNKGRGGGIISVEALVKLPIFIIQSKTRASTREFSEN